MENDIIQILAVSIFLGTGVLFITILEASGKAVEELNHYKQRHEKYLNGEIDNL